MSQDDSKSSRRRFLGQAAIGAAGAALTPNAARSTVSQPIAPPHVSEPPQGSGAVEYPRIFTGRHLSMIAFPLGGVGAGSVSLGGRGQLRDWEIFNRADKGNNLSYALPSIWVQADNSKSMARVLEARYQPPYEGQDGLGSQN